MSERRKHPRSEFPVDAVAYTGNVVVRCRMENLSLGGAALSTKVEMNPGAFLRLHFTLGAGTAVDADAVIVRALGSGSGYSWGVAFVGLEAATAARIEHALRAPPPKSEKPASSRPPSRPPPPKSSPPSTRPPAAAPGSKRELRDLFKEALNQLDKKR